MSRLRNVKISMWGDFSTCPTEAEIITAIKEGRSTVIEAYDIPIYEKESKCGIVEE